MQGEVKADLGLSLHLTTLVAELVSSHAGIPG